MSGSTIWLGCGALQAELRELRRLGKIGGEVRHLDSMLHMAPQRLEIELTQSLTQSAGEDSRLVLVYGDCCPRMLDLVRRFRVGRVNAINCPQLLLGCARYRELMQEQAFLFLPEWALRWKDIMRMESSLSEEVAHDLMREHCRVLVYLDTGLVPVPQQALADCSACTGLPWRVETVALDHFLARLLEAEASVTGRASEEGVG